MTPWWGPAVAGWLGACVGLIGAVMGLGGAMGGIGLARGRAGLTRAGLALMGAGMVVGIASLVAGITGVVVGQRYEVYYPLLLPGVVLWPVGTGVRAVLRTFVGVPFPSGDVRVQAVPPRTRGAVVAAWGPKGVARQGLVGWGLVMAGVGAGLVGLVGLGAVDEPMRRWMGGALAGGGLMVGASANVLTVWMMGRWAEVLTRQGEAARLHAEEFRQALRGG